MIHLTDRELEVMDLIGGDGAHYCTVAKALNISIHTVREHVRRIAAKAGGPHSPRETVVLLYHSELVATGGTTAEGDF